MKQNIIVKKYFENATIENFWKFIKKVKFKTTPDLYFKKHLLKLNKDAGIKTTACSCSYLPSLSMLGAPLWMVQPRSQGSFSA